jgi:nicotinamide mononucleotide transporter
MEYLIRLLYTYAEHIGMGFSLLFVLFAIKQNVWCWLFGGIGAVFYIFAYYQYKFYADMSLQFYYVAVSVYGWWSWKYGKQEDTDSPLSISQLSFRQWLQVLLVTAAVFGVYVYFLTVFTDSPVIIGDSFTTAVCIVATYLAARKVIDNWLLFIVADAVAIALYLYKGMYPTVLLFAVYTVMAVAGYFRWREEINRS